MPPLLSVQNLAHCVLTIIPNNYKPPQPPRSGGFLIVLSAPPASSHLRPMSILICFVAFMLLGVILAILDLQ